MSVEAVSWALALEIPCAMKMVLVCLAHRADENGVCWPGHGDTARRASVDESTVIRHIKAIEQAGLLMKTDRFTESGQQVSNVYQLFLDRTAVIRRKGRKVQPTTGCEGGGTLPSTIYAGGVAPCQEGGGSLPPPGVAPCQEGGGTVPPKSSENLHLESSLNHHIPSASSSVKWMPQALVVECEDSLAILNREARRNFKAYNPNGSPTANLTVLMARRREGWTKEQIDRMTMLKCRKWRDDHERREWLNPDTLYGRKKFAKYVGELADRQQAQRGDAARSRPLARPLVETDLTKAESWEPSEADKEALRNAAGTVKATVQMSGGG